jgi:surface antigen
MKRFLLLILLIGFAGFFGYRYSKRVDLNSQHTIGQVLDSIDGVAVYYNGGVDHVLERNVAADGYNLGLKYQCVEFVKRYYYEQYGHKMPDSYGHAKSFFDPALADGQMNTKRGLVQFKNRGATPPQTGDILVFDDSLWNPYGHVAIVFGLESDYIEIIQQNPGPYGKSREKIALKVLEGKYALEKATILGWLRRPL